MRLALIADIHGNLAALDAVLAAIAADGIARIVCLGDVAATGPQPREVLARLRDLGCPVVMGNADWELLAPDAAPAPPPGSDAARWRAISAWAAAQLSPADLAFLRSFQPTVRVPLSPFADLLAVHGSPRNFNDIIRATTPDDELAPMLAATLAGDECPALLAGGHTHVPLLRPYQTTILVNPGSVGLASQTWADGSTIVPAYAEYAVLVVAAEHQQLTFHRVAYDQAATIQAMYERDMPHAAWWAAEWQWNREQP